ncbi:response regulator [Sphingomonas sp. BIUV-7]|uniref:Response regulator n=1 Tax=Sphingomonas natans TaxID=3063330 RepID=A0ABT8YEQ3_9SPHN|nr:response regulator [Sphingomonas sp. BIUV-7]MDO6416427.1 response regulator [Sphingomonas sp. BIUV-7]
MQQTQASAEPCPVESAPSAAGRHFQGKVLLVDDQEVVRKVTAEMLSDIGLDVVEASSAEAALLLMEDGIRPDLVVTDHYMPGMSGADLVRTLRSRSSVLPVLIMSGCPDADFGLPGIPTLTKPFRSAELTSRVCALMPPVSPSSGIC